jgi:hypothetical protein
VHPLNINKAIRIKIRNGNLNFIFGPPSSLLFFSISLLFIMMIPPETQEWLMAAKGEARLYRAKS